MSAQFGVHTEFHEELELLAKHYKGFLLLDKCDEGNFSVRCRFGESGETYSYPDVLQVCCYIRYFK